MQKEKSYYIPLLLFILSFIIRLALISKGPYHIDCLDLALKAEKTLSTFQIQYLSGSGYPFTIILGSIFIFFARLFSIKDPVIAVNFMSVVFGSLCVPFLYILVKKLFNSLSATLSAVMLSIFPVFLALSVYGKSHTPSLFFLLFGLVFLLSYKKTHSLSSLILSATSIGLMGSTRLQDMILMVIPLCFFFFLWDDPESDTPKDKRSAIKSFVIFTLIVSVIVVAFHLPFILEGDQTGYTSQMGEFVKRGVTINFLGLFSYGLKESFLIAVANFTAGGIIFALIGLFMVSKKNVRTFLFLLLWFLVPLLFYGNLRTTVPRLLVLSFLPLIITQGYLFSTLITYSKKLKYVGIFAFSLIFILCLTSIFPILHLRHNYDLLPNYCRIVKNLTEDNALIITADEGPFINYYANRGTMYQMTSHLTDVNDETFREYKKGIDAAFEKNQSVYITGPALFSNNPNQNFSRLMAENYDFFSLGLYWTEDWHWGETYQRIGKWHFWKIEQKF